jgi:hypothetical protein
LPRLFPPACHSTKTAGRCENSADCLNIPYKKTLYEMPYASPIRFAMSTLMERTPFSISETWLLADA